MTSSPGRTITPEEAHAIETPGQASSTGNAPYVLCAERLELTFGVTPALSGASVNVNAGEVLAIVGPSGSGKSTMLHCLAGLLRPQVGAVYFEGKRIDDAPDSVRSRLRRQSFGFVFQSSSLVPDLTAAENVALSLRLNGVRRRAADAAARDWLERLGVADVADRRPSDMSGGQAQRVAVARALVGRPKIVFADEPTGALDTENRSSVLAALLGAARENGAAVVLVTHDLELASAADRVVRFQDGRPLDPQAPQ
jgi:putative ABC transport system ATP-binding protein